MKKVKPRVGRRGRKEGTEEMGGYAVAFMSESLTSRAENGRVSTYDVLMFDGPL